MEGRVVPTQEYSRRLPPPEAWKHPNLWLDFSTGLVKPDIQRLVLPTDDRQLLRPDEVVELVNDTYFWPDYDWPYDPQDPETAPDDHHFYFTAQSYHPDEHAGNDTPKRFRELPTHIGRMPRQFHNAIHDLTQTPAVPQIETMEHYHDSYKLAHQAFKRLIETARKATEAQTRFGIRRRSLQMGLVDPSSPHDEVGQEILRSFFAKHFAAYSESFEIWRALPAPEKSLLEIPDVNVYKPHLIVRRLGKVASRQHINFVPVIRAA